MLACLKNARAKHLEQKGIKPLALPKFLQESQDVSPAIHSGRTGIASGTVMAWHRWRGASEYSTLPKGRLKGWRMEGDRYQPCEQHIQALCDLVNESITTSWDTEIQQIGGFSSSKSRLEELESIDVMAIRKSPEMVDEITEQKLKSNLAWREIRIINSPDTTADFFVKHGWDDLTYLINDGGSHHFAAARHIAGKLELKVPLRGSLVKYSIDRDSVIALRREFEMFTIRAESLPDFFDAMRQFGAPFFRQELPGPRHQDTCAVFLPRSSERSMKAAQLLHAAGWTDLGEHLAELSLNQ